MRLKKGITVNVKMLPQLISALQKAEGAAVKAGLLVGVGSSPGRGGYRPGAGRKKGSTKTPDNRGSEV